MRLVNLQELLDPIDVFRRLLGLRLQDLYNLLLRRGWTLGSISPLRLDARGDPRLPRPASAPSRAPLARQPPGPGGFAGPEFQPGALREPEKGHCPAAPSSPYSRIWPTIRLTFGSSARSNFLSAVPTGPSSRPAAGPSRGAYLPDLGDDPAPALLRADHRGSRRSSGDGWASTRRRPRDWSCLAARDQER